MPYLPRVADTLVADRLAAMGGVLIEGPRASGKTETGLHHAASFVRLDESPGLATVAENAPDALLEGPVPRLIDEWQLAPVLWNAVRHEIDDRRAPGQFILSGSATPPDDITRHSGVGRIARVRLRTMTLAESGRSSRQVSLTELMTGADRVSARSELRYRDVAAEAVRGGWPALIDASTADAQRFNREYAEELTRADIRNATGVRRDVDRLRRTLEALSRNLSTEASIATLAADVGGADGRIDPDTVREYLDAFTAVFALETLPAWSVNLRSRSRLRTKPTIHLADPALACAVLGIGPERLALDPEYFGFVFESMAVRDLRVYSALHDGRVYRYRDNTGLEVDAVIEYPGGVWGAAEVKLGGSAVAAAEASLLKLRDERVDVARVGAPAYLAVITATEYAYTLPSGVHVIPLATLGA
ncbi:ATP-binding protein [Agromyces bauzanensis]|uniref:ATPase AAA n=1 Tax=Agromyces bauzanensis TaxID=1308924 RepID=A0A917UXT1_9MICO|nr:DUF4143 domain-containing protein [Agromyces bauzanensis]GGJ94050.1 ATPase AAA [Agromyces bauzanensis]